MWINGHSKYNQFWTMETIDRRRSMRTFSTCFYADTTSTTNEALIACGSSACRTVLDNPNPVVDFQLGAVDRFSGNVIGDCNGFICDEEPKTTTLFHYGTDGWKLEYVK